MPLNFNNNFKTTIIIYSIIIAIILIQKPKLIFNDNMDLKIIVLSKDKKISFPVLYVVIVLAAFIAYFIPTL